MPSSRILKGALAYSDAQVGVPKPVVFQFNPEEISRTQQYHTQNKRTTEELRFELVFNAMSAMERSDDQDQQNIYPYIAATEEILAYQKRVQRTSWLDILLRRSKPVLLFIYGQRIVPVRLQRLVIRELMHDNTLKPVHATANLRLRVLSEQDLHGNRQGLAILANYRNQRRNSADLLDVDTNIF